MSDPVVRRTAEIIDHETQTRSIELEAPGHDDKSVSIIIRPSELTDPRKVVAKLLDAGAKIEVNSTTAQISALSTVVADKELAHPKDGWNFYPEVAFGTRDKMIGGKDAYHLDRNREPSKYANYTKIRRSGDLAGALLLAKMCFDSVVLMLGLAAGYAAIVMGFLRMMPPVILFFGLSKSGKTTGALLAGSHFGQHRDDHLLQLSDTATGSEEVAIEMVSRAIVLDETSSVDISPANLVRLVRQRTFNFSRGREKVRASSYNGGKSGREISGLIIITGVDSISSLAKAENIKMTDGMASRLLEFQAHEDDHESCWDSYPDDMSDKAKKAYGDRKLAEVRALLEKHHGLTHEVFIRKIVANPQQAEASLRRFMEEFKAHPDTLKSDVLSHALHSYSVFYAAARFAMEAGLMPDWPNKLRKLMQRGLKRLEWVGKEEERIASKAFKRLIEAMNAAPERSKLTCGDSEKHPIFWRKKAGRKVECVISVTEFRRLAGDKRALNLLFERLLRQERIAIRHPKETTWMMKVQANMTWSDGEKYKAIVVRAKG